MTPAEFDYLALVIGAMGAFALFLAYASIMAPGKK